VVDKRKSLGPVSSIHADYLRAANGYSQSLACDQGPTSSLLYPSQADTPLSVLGMCKECQEETTLLGPAHPGPGK